MMKHVRWIVLLAVLVCPRISWAVQQPSLFRGVVVVDSPLGVRVVSVEESSQAFQADLRPEDVIVRVHGQELHSIDEFATLSMALGGRVMATTVLIFRNGTPRELPLHLYSYPILRQWGVEFVPNDELHFVEAKAGLDYWTRLGRGFEQAHKPSDALEAYLNGLHHVPTDIPTALNVSELLLEVSQQQLHSHDLAVGLSSLRQAVLILQKLFESSLTEEQLQRVKNQLKSTLQALQKVRPQAAGPAAGAAFH